MAEHLDVGAQDSACRRSQLWQRWAPAPPRAVSRSETATTSCAWSPSTTPRAAPRTSGHVCRSPHTRGGRGPPEPAAARGADVAATLLLDEAAAEDYRRRGLRAFLIVPVMRDDRPEGILRLGHAHGPRSFDAPTVTFAEFMARYAGLLLSGEQAGLARHPEAGSPVDDDLATPEPSPAGEASADHTTRYAAGAGAPDTTQAWSAEEGLRRVALAAVTAQSGHPGVSFCALTLSSTDVSASSPAPPMEPAAGVAA